jgi:hypothetical protein
MIKGEDIADLVAVAQNELGAGKIEDLASTLTDTVAYGQLMKDNRVKFESGPELEWPVLLEKGNNSRFVGFYEPDSSNIKNGVGKAKVPWCHFTNNWSYDEKELMLNPEKGRILSLVEQRQNMAIIDEAETLEDVFWDTPDATDETLPFAIRYYLVAHITGTSATTGGFNGTVPSGFTTVANLNPTTYPAWANFTKKWVNMSRADFVDGVITAMYKTGFKSPIKTAQHSSARDEFEMFTTFAVVKEAEKLVEANNDNLGQDLAKYNGQVFIRRAPLIPVPQLDANDSTGAAGYVFGVNWATWEICFPTGGYWSQSAPIRNGKAHSVWTVYRDLSVQIRCLNRRRNFVVSKTA